MSCCTLLSYQLQFAPEIQQLSGDEKTAVSIYVSELSMTNDLFIIFICLYFYSFQGMNKWIFSGNSGTRPGQLWWAVPDERRLAVGAVGFIAPADLAGEARHLRYLEIFGHFQRWNGRKVGVM